MPTSVVTEKLSVSSTVSTNGSDSPRLGQRPAPGAPSPRPLDGARHVEHLARIESILQLDMGLSRDDAQAFIRAGNERVFGSHDIDLGGGSFNGGAAFVKLPSDGVGVWMNELREDYDEKTYTPNITKSVLVNFEGSRIRVRRPQRRVVPLAEVHDEKEEIPADFIWAEERLYDARNADVFLLPLEVPVKIRWLNRFPIAVKLKPLQQPQAGGALIVESRPEVDAKFVAKDGNTLFFFARCDRAKEEIFWHFVSASGQVPFPFKVPRVTPTPDMSPLNALLTRIGGDVLVDPVWKQLIFEKVAQKISQIKKPYFLAEIRMTHMDMGDSLPTLSNVSQRIKMDRLGVWFTMDMSLQGPIVSTIVTHVDLRRFQDPEQAKAAEFKQDGEVAGAPRLEERQRIFYNTLSGLYGGYEHEELQEDRELPEAAKPQALKWLESLGESKIFKWVSQLGFVRKKLDELSSTDITVLAVVKSIRGRLALNVPPAPSDRLWYGFLPGTQLDIEITLKVGETRIELEPLSEYIDTQMRSLFAQVITLPNMDDYFLPFANSAIDTPDYRLNKLRELIISYT
ncbi:testis-expressed protein 2-like [Paramacrobiotus metropolitanus]|uniref:testis-expressed protein 2-like n=1 Tax=Paramacrobiotus metropolitanus TaxID=2943436 RepID=UPI002445A577|nr:testis-expressed protein 2-like [Paramacrobiotus metropolitanus]